MICDLPLRIVVPSILGKYAHFGWNTQLIFGHNKKLDKMTKKCTDLSSKFVATHHKKSVNFEYN